MFCKYICAESCKQNLWNKLKPKIVQKRLQGLRKWNADTVSSPYAYVKENQKYQKIMLFEML